MSSLSEKASLYFNRILYRVCICLSVIQASDKSTVLSTISLSGVSLDHYHLTKGRDPSQYYP